MKYKIGTLSDLLGISSEAIRLYEREGIIQAKREEGSGYRFFQRLDLTALFRARTYHNYGFRNKETQKLLNSTNLNDIVEIYAQREQELEQEIQRKQYTLEYLEHMRQLVSKAEENNQICTVTTSPHFYHLEFMEDGELLIGKKDYSVFARWSNETPFVAMSHRSILEDLKQKKTHQVTALMVEKKYLDVFDLPVDYDFVKEWKPCWCIYTIVQEAGEQFDEFNCLRHVFDFAEKNQIEIIGDPITRTFVSYDIQNAYIRCREVWIPIAE